MAFTAPFSHLDIVSRCATGAITWQIAAIGPNLIRDFAAVRDVNRVIKPNRVNDKNPRNVQNYYSFTNIFRLCHSQKRPRNSYFFRELGWRANDERRLFMCMGSRATKRCSGLMSAANITLNAAVSILVRLSLIIDSLVHSVYAPN